MEIRKATINELDSIVNIKLKSPELNDSEILEIKKYYIDLIKDGIALIGIENGAIIALMAGEKFPSYDYSEVEDFWIEPGIENRGLPGKCWKLMKKNAATTK